jgi:arylsulfatase A-like enzyme
MAASADDSRPPKPNVILLVTDDLGWQDVKCYDIDQPSPMETPNIDALAKKGVLFRQAYSPAPTCSPTRCAIMSGTHPARAQMTHVSGGKPPHPHHKTGWALMSPWYTARLPADAVTLAEALKQNGYVTGHSGKWHMAKGHFGPPTPEDHGIDVSYKSRGVQVGMTPDRLTGFATRNPGDPFRLDENGFPFDQTHHDAMTFVRENKDQPFFLYYATWLVHGPWVMRSEELLNKYVKKLGVELTEEAKTGWKGEGQTHPFYCAMVEQLDYYCGKLFDYLETTEDPRWPGHMLSENTYIIFTSDNGGAEGGPNETVTDNYPLDQGKISLMEGGTRVPLIITGPGIQAGVDSDVMINGLDFFPTILSLVGAEKPAEKQFDGLDLSNLLLTDPTDAALVRQADGSVRDTMVWHFPNSGALESSIRIGDYKLVRNYGHVDLRSKIPELELYRLYNSEGGGQQRVDIEEAKNLAEAMPEKAAQMNARLTEILTEMKASYPYLNPACPRLPNTRLKVPTVLSHTLTDGRAEFTYRENGAPVVRASLIYTKNGGQPHEEWFREPANLLSNNKISAELPPGTTHYVINLIDQNNYLVSYPEITDGKTYSQDALSATDQTVAPTSAARPNASAASSDHRTRMFAHMDKDRDGKISRQEYVGHFVSSYDNMDIDNDGKLTANEFPYPAALRFGDKDKDGKLNREEFPAIYEMQFKNLDKNKDGGLTVDER